jgi:hypothetical protein
MSQWDVPPPGTTWSTPGAAPPPGFPTAPPTGPRAGPAVGARPPKQRAAQRTQALAVATSAGLAAAGLASVAVVAAVRRRADALDGLTFDGLVAMSDLERNRVFTTLTDADDAVGVALAPYGVAALVTGILWIVWQRRIVRNSMPFGQITGSIGWGTWGWIVPFANLYYPESQLAQAARISDPDRLRREGGSGATPFVYLWWASWTGSSILSLGGSWTAPSPVELALGRADISDLQRADLIQSLGFGLGVLAAVFGIATVLHTTHRQRTMLAALGVAA